MKTRIILLALSIPVISSIAYGVDTLFISIPLFTIMGFVITYFIMEIFYLYEENQTLSDFYENKCEEIDKLRKLFSKGDYILELKQKLKEKRKEVRDLKTKLNKYENKNRLSK